MSNIISWDCGYRLEPWNKCGFLGLQSSWATFSTQNRTLHLLAGDYKQSVGNFLWFLPIQFRNPQYGGTQWHLQLWPPHRPSPKVTMVMAPKKPADCWCSWSPAREPGPWGLWGWANPRETQIVHANRDMYLLAEWLKGLPCPIQTPHSYRFLCKVALFSSPPFFMNTYSCCVIFAVLKTNVYWSVFSSLLFCAHPASQLLSIHLHLLFVRTLLILQKWYPLVFVIPLCTEKNVIFSEKEINKESICAKRKGGGRKREWRKDERNLVFALRGFPFKGFISLLTMLIYHHLYQHPVCSTDPLANF